MGLFVGFGGNSPLFPYDYFYGIEWDANVSDPACVRIGRAELHASLPIQSRMRRCILNDAGQVVYYLGANNSLLTDTGAVADLTGLIGQVMVEVPEHYRKIEVTAIKNRAYISEYPLPGFVKVPKMYIAAYKATVNRVTSKLASVVNLSVDYRGGGNNATLDANNNTQLGKAATAISRTTFRTYARNRGAIWYQKDNNANKNMYWLFAVEFATFNSQAAVTSVLTAQGYKQGGLGDGVTNVDGTAWSTFNGYYPLIPCGTSNSLGNRSGEVAYTIPGFIHASGVVKVNSFRGIENPFGEIWEWVDGVNIYHQTPGEGGKSLVYCFDNPALFVDDTTVNAVLRGELPRSSGWIKRMLLGETGEILPAEVGGGSTTYHCDYFWTPVLDPSYGWRALLSSAKAHHGSNSGLACAASNYGASETGTNFGSRLCCLGA